MTEGPLAHLRVLDLTRLFPGAYCTGMLADLGADVLRVEPPDGRDPVRAMAGGAVAYQRGTRSLALHLRHPEAPAVVQRLIETVDVVVDSGLPSVLRDAGIGYEAVAAQRPEIVWASITGFGRGSPYADRAGHDIAFLGYSGLLALMAGDAVPPTPDFVLASPLAALVAVVGILAAAAERDRTGRGRYVDASLVDSPMWVLGEAVARVAAGGQAGWGPAASRRAYRAADGRMVTLSAAEPRTWSAFCAGIDRADLESQLLADAEGQAVLTAELTAVFATRAASEWVEHFAGTAAAVGPVLTVEDLLTDPHVLARGGIVQLAEPSHPPARALRSPVHWVDPDGRPVPFAPGPPPAVGEHTDDALRAAGYSPEEIARLRRDGAL